MKNRVLPKHLYREDGERFTLNQRGLYTMDSSKMADPHKYSYSQLMSVSKRCFSTQKP